MSLPQGKTTLYFQLITRRRFAEAERLLEDLKHQASSTEWSRGYLNALEGMLGAIKSDDDQYAFIRKLEFDPKKIGEVKTEFIDHSRNRLHDDFDRGFFTAWADYMRVLAKWKPSELPQPNPPTPMEATNPPGKKPIGRCPSKNCPKSTPWRGCLPTLKPPATP